MKSVSLIFGGEAKVKVMRLFIFNPGLILTAAEVSHRAKENPNTTRRELMNLVKAGLLKKKSKGYTLNPSYIYLPAIGNFLIDATPMSEKEIVKKLSRVGNVKLVLISGVFLHDPDTRVDMLIVGDNLSQAKLSHAIASIEAELGKELRYTAFETDDFKYRMGIYDKLIRDILDSRHKNILNKLGIETGK